MGTNDGFIRGFTLNSNSNFRIRRTLRWSIFFVFLTAIGAELISPSVLGKGNNVSAYSNTAGAATFASVPTPTQRPTRTFTPGRGAPAAPSNLAASASSTNQINLTWTVNSNNQTGFRVERAVLSTGPWMQVGTAPADSTSWGNAGLSELTTYYYRIIAYNSAGNSPYSNVASATTQSRLPAGAPSHLEATTRGSTQINLSWSDNSSNEIGFKIERCQGSDCSSFTEIATTAARVTHYESTGRIDLRWKPAASNGGAGVAGYTVYQAGVRIVNTAKTRYSVTGLAASVLYCYTVTAYDKEGNRSDQSAPACATTKPDSTADPDPSEKPN